MLPAGRGVRRYRLGDVVVAPLPGCVDSIETRRGSVHLVVRHRFGGHACCALARIWSLPVLVCHLPRCAAACGSVFSGSVEPPSSFHTLLHRCAETGVGYWVEAKRILGITAQFWPSWARRLERDVPSIAPCPGVAEDGLRSLLEPALEDVTSCRRRLLPTALGGGPISLWSSFDCVLLVGRHLETGSVVANRVGGCFRYRAARYGSSMSLSRARLAFGGSRAMCAWSFKCSGPEVAERRQKARERAESGPDSATQTDGPTRAQFRFASGLAAKPLWFRRPQASSMVTFYSMFRAQYKLCDVCCRSRASQSLESRRLAQACHSCWQVDVDGRPYQASTRRVAIVPAKKASFVSFGTMV